MSDLISRSEVIEELNKYEKELRKDRIDAIETDDENMLFAIANQLTAICRIKRNIMNMPTAYSVDGVVEELEIKENEAVLKAPNTSDLQNPDYQKWMMKSYGFKEAIEIVKQGCVRNNRKDCEYRHDNGNCLKVGGFCTSVDDKHCEKMKQGGVSYDVCEWKEDAYGRWHTQCNILADNSPLEYTYCPYCRKKIKVVK